VSGGYVKLRMDDREHDVSVGTPDADGRCAVTVDGVEHVVETLGRREAERRLAVDGRRITLHAASSEDGTWISFAGRTRFVAGPSSGPTGGNRKRKASPGGGAGARAVTPAFPSVVVAVLVAVGDDVRRGQELIVVSAMKMESRLTSPRDGRVKAIRAAVGASVRPGDELVELEPAAGGAADE
jgi:3-methylcrotonyl-CoA carboxylase alpha subunit